MAQRTDADTAALSYGECLRRLDEANGLLATCDDVDEHVRLVRSAEAYLRQARERISDADRLVAESLDQSDGASGAGHAETRGLPYKECLRRVETAVAQLGTCEDVDEVVEIVRGAELNLREARRRIADAEGALTRIMADAAEAEGAGIDAVR